MKDSSALNFIGGEFKPAVGGSFFEHRDPSSGEVDAQVADSGLLDLVQAIQAGNHALIAWQRLTLPEKASIFDRVASIFEERSEELSLLQARDTGSPVRYNRSLSMPAAAARFRENANVLRDLSAAPETGVQTFSHPIGLAAVVTTWSDPFDQLALRVAAALASGNAVIAKPSKYAPRCGQAFAEIMQDAGLPAGVFNLVQGRGPEVGRAIAQHPGLRHIAFCGTTEVGQVFMTESVEPLKKIHLSLGSKNPILVFQGNDLKKTAEIVARIAAGCHPAQCLRGSRLFIQESIFKEFLALVESELRAMVAGPATDENTEIGPLISRTHADVFKRSVAQALGEKGKPGSPSQIPENGGFFVPPTLISDLTYCSTLQQTEVIGPLITATSFKYQHEALKYANGNPFGHSGYIFEPDAAKARKVASKLETGCIYTNLSHLPHSPHTTGLKSSGLGHSTKDLRRFFSHDTFLS